MLISLICIYVTALLLNYYGLPNILNNIDNMFEKTLTMNFINNIGIFLIIGVLFSIIICLILFHMDNRKQFKLLNEKMAQNKITNNK